MLFISVLIFLSVSVNGWSHVWVCHIVWKFDILRWLAVVLARIISPENTDEGTVWLLNKALMHFWFLHALVLRVEVSPLSWSENYRFFIELHHLSIHIINQDLICFLLICPIPLCLRSLPPSNAWGCSHRQERVIRLQVPQIHCLWCVVSNLFRVLC